jgi:uncharacterized protein YecT (DUF1311 family)
MFQATPDRQTGPEQGAPIEKESDRVNRWNRRILAVVVSQPPSKGPEMLRPILALLAAGLPFSASAASFDCARAAAADERAICANRGLNDRDVRMSVLYGLDLRFVPMGSRDVIRRDQAAWLAKRRACGANGACLTRAYDARIAELQAVIDTRVYPQGPF